MFKSVKHHGRNAVKVDGVLVSYETRVAHMSAKEWAEAEIMLRRLRGILDRIGRDATMEEVATWLH